MLGTLCLTACLTLHGLIDAARAASANDCEEAGRAAEQRFALPSGLLVAIGRIESGRWDATHGRSIPWPWTVDFEGQGRLFNTRAEAVRTTRDALQTGLRNIDVGCYQINLLRHPFAFADLDQAFDAQANAEYAARFLAALHERLGTWPAAVAAYHSADPQLGGPYRQRVYATWSGGAPGSDIVGLTIIAGVRIWTPSPAGSAPGMIVLQAARRDLPRVITPGG